VTANPTILAKAIEGSDDYDTAFVRLLERGLSVDDAYWHLVLDDIRDAAAVLGEVHATSDGTYRFVSIEVAPELAHDTAATITSVRNLHTRINLANVFVKIPATAAGVPAIEAMIAEGRNINVTLIFSLSSYRQVIDAYLSGLERFAPEAGDLRHVHSVASFFVSRVDTQVDHRLEHIETDAALSVRGRAAVAQARLAYSLFQSCFRGERWDRLAARGARPQRPLWASTSTKNPRATGHRRIPQLLPRRPRRARPQSHCSRTTLRSTGNHRHRPRHLPPVGG
jgi:transaldolase